MKWRIAVWVARIAVVAAVLYGVWCGVAYFIGKHYFRQGMQVFASSPKVAMQRFEVAVKVQPRNAQYRAALGRAALKARQFPAAATHLQRAADLRPEDFGIWHDLGEAYLQANAPAEAVRAFRRALEIRPESELALAGLADAATQAGDSQAALDPLRQLWKRTPNDVALGGKLASALVKEGQYDEALQVCATIKRKAPKVEPGELWGGGPPRADWTKWCPVLVAEGDAHRAKGRLSEAIIAYQRCLMAQPEHQAALSGLSKVPTAMVRHLAPDRKARGPRFSPDGKRVAFHGGALFIADLEADTVAKVAPWARRSGDARPAWSPDGTRICYADDRKLQIANADGSGARALISKRAELPELTRLGIRASWAPSLEFESDPAWSPDGRTVAAYLHQDHGGGFTVVVDPKSGIARARHRAGPKPPAFSAGHPPAWSRDGRLLCGPLTYGEDKPGLTLWSAEGATRRQLALPGGRTTGFNHTDRTVTWSPDSKHIAALVTVAQSHRTALAIVPLVSGPSRMVAEDVVAHRWVDASHVWLLQWTGDNYVTARLRALTCDLKGNLQPAKEPFPILLLGEWDLDPKTTFAAMAGPSATLRAHDKGLWVFDLEKLREAK